MQDGIYWVAMFPGCPHTDRVEIRGDECRFLTHRFTDGSEESVDWYGMRGQWFKYGKRFYFEECNPIPA